MAKTKRQHGGPALAPAAEQVCRVIANTEVNSEYRHLILRAGPPASEAGPGQFFHLLCPASGEDRPFLRRPMSVHGIDPRRRRLEFLYKVTGAGTRGLASLGPDDTLNVLGPLGVGFRLEAGWKNIVVVGRGVGLATLAPLARMANESDIGITAILSARRPGLIMAAETFAAQNARVIAVTDEQGTSAVASVERLLRGLIADGQADALFTCGSNRLMLLLQRLAREHGLPGQVALEQQMACGLGMCFCCVRDFNVEGAITHRRVCWEGPVFDIQEALSW
ncbi:MAG: dihydroorotate dehydrogenase electron transfer subunit [Alphaproteobacteria bacterium]